LKRNYAFIFLIIMVAWVTKIFLHASPGINSFGSFYQALGLGPSIPSWFVAVVFTATFASIVGIVIYVTRHGSGEISEFGAHRSLWRI
jgi:uncharacterized membrane protein